MQKTKTFLTYKLLDVLYIMLINVKLLTIIYEHDRITLVNVNAPVVATTSWWLHFTAPVVA